MSDSVSTTWQHSHSLLDPALLERIKGLALVARRVVEGALHGLHRSPLHGLSIEFAQHRQYVPGDELKRLDWRVLARSDRYVIKQYEQETNMRVVLVLDCSRSMAFGGPPEARRDQGIEGSRDRGNQDSSHATMGTGAEVDNASASADTVRIGSTVTNGDNALLATRYSELAGSKFHYARITAAALAYLLLQQGDSVGLMLANYRVVEQVAPRAAPGHILSICQLLESATPSGITDVSSVLVQLAARLKRRSLVVLLSDLLDNPDELLAALGQLSHRGHEVLALQILDPREVEFDLGSAGYGVTVVRDMETGEEFEAEPLLVRELVRAEIRRFCEFLDAGVRRHNVHLLRCRTDEPVERLLTQYLHSRLRGKRR